MCGFVALMKKRITKVDKQLIRDATRTLMHRGPDAEAFSFSKCIGFGFRRLSIMEHEAGAQPFKSRCGRYETVFNGEIYNYLELRVKLEKAGKTFKTNSEVEIVTELYKQIGNDFARELRGMFSIVIFDHTLKSLVAVRDGFGIKPLYYKLKDDDLYLMSELKVLRREKGTSGKQLNKAGLGDYFTFQYIPEPDTFLNGVRSLEAGHLLTYDFTDGLRVRRLFDKKIFPNVYISNISAEILREVVTESIHAHMMSDVEVGCFLSGGIDSTITTTIASTVNPNLKAFSIGYENAKVSELDDAIKTAEALNIELYTKKVSATEYMNAAREAIYFMDTPVADPSATMLYLLSGVASKHVKAVLSGEGADELFGGYPIYKEVLSLEGLTRLPGSWRAKSLKLADKVPFDVKGKGFIKRGCTELRHRYIGNAFMFDEHEKQDLLPFYNECRHWKDSVATLYDEIAHFEYLNQMQSVDMNFWMTGDILMKADKMPMAHGLEVRVPFLDERVFKVASELIREEKISRKQGKILLRDAFRDVIPKHMYQMKKRGFPVPLARWLRDELYDDTKNILKSPVATGWINQKVSLQLLEEHATKKKDLSRKIWTIATFIMWLESWGIN